MARKFQSSSLEKYARYGSIYSTFKLSTQATEENFLKISEVYLTAVDETPPKPKKRPQSATSGAQQYPNRPRITSSVNFAKQTGRKGLPNKFDAHPNRFMSFNDSPSVFSKTRRVSTPNIEVVTSRDEHKSFVDKSFEEDYEVSFAVTDMKQGVNFMGFKQEMKRHPLFKPSPYANIPIRTRDYFCVDKKSSTPNMKKESEKPTGRTPEFMIALNSKTGLEVISAKSLEMNYYCSRGYPEIKSEFSTPEKGEKKRVKASMLDMLKKKFRGKNVK